MTFEITPELAAVYLGRVAKGLTAAGHTDVDYDFDQDEATGWVAVPDCLSDDACDRAFGHSRGVTLVWVPGGTGWSAGWTDTYRDGRNGIACLTDLQLDIAPPPELLVEAVAAIVAHDGRLEAGRVLANPVERLAEYTAAAPETPRSENAAPIEANKTLTTELEMLRKELNAIRSKDEPVGSALYDVIRRATAGGLDEHAAVREIDERLVQPLTARLREATARADQGTGRRRNAAAYLSSVRDERDRLARFVARLRELAFMGGQDSDSARRSMQHAFTEFDDAHAGTADQDPSSDNRVTGQPQDGAA